MPFLNFLNGVCRHEQKMAVFVMTKYFLNGVCRHELFNRKIVFI
ncbi:hypothetical protein URS_2218 [Acinetobacter ursingii]|nr:hypothetical protein URS_2218 [Acinetobacter ursingii]